MDTKDLKRMLEAVAPGAADRKDWDFGQTIGREGQSSETPESGAAEIDPSIGQARVGAVLESGTRYEILEEIGRGGMGLVFRGSQSEVQRPVAIKALKRKRVHQKGCREAFFSEARILGMLDHPNIVPIHDLLLLEDGEAAIAMREVSGTSWLQLLHPSTAEQRAKADGYAIEDHLDILITVCNAVAYAHSKGLVHRDLKPSNVMVGAFGEVLLMDWGMAVTFDEELLDPNHQRPRTAKSVTMPGGSPGYMAPEMATAKGEYLGPWTDVYLLGGILHEILTGEMPHQGGSLYKVVKAAFKSEPKEYGAEVPEELARICRKSMARKLKDRYQRVEEFQQALRDFLRHRESHAIVASSDRKLDDISEETGQVLQREESRNAVYQTLAEALAGYRQAQVLWAGNETAVAGERRARLLFARKAFESGDFGLARSHLEGVRDEPEARSLSRSIDGELASRVRDEASTQRTKKAGIAAAALLVVGLSTAVIVVAMEKSRASNSERQARALAQEAQANLVRAQDSELIARRAAKEAEASARLAADEARAKALALDQIQAEKSRADVSERKAKRMAQQATHNASEAKRREKEARAALDKARAAERRARTLARQARAEAREKTEALGEVQRLADLVLLQRLQRGGETLISRPAEGSSDVAGWVADAKDLVSRLSSHRQALVKFQLTASKGRDGIGRDLKRLEGLIGQLDRKRTALEVVARPAAETRSQRTEIARLEENLNQLQVKAAGFSGYRFDGDRDRWRYQTLRELVAGLEDLQRPGGLIERVRAVGRGN